MFIAYTHRLPSRQIYLASAGLALIVGASIVALRERTCASYTWLTAVILSIMLLHNVGYLWTKKRRQYMQRAQPTEQLIAFARRVNAPIYVRCFPRPSIIGDAAVALALGKPTGTLIWDEEKARPQQAVATFCYESK